MVIVLMSTSSSDQHSPSRNSSDSLTSTTNSKLQSPNPHNFVENLGPEKLTALGRVDAARVMVDSLKINGANTKAGSVARRLVLWPNC